MVTFTVVEGQVWGGAVADFHFVSATDTPSAAIDWGDGSSGSASSVVPDGSGGWAVYGTHQYQHGEHDYMITVTAADDGETATAYGLGIVDSVYGMAIVVAEGQAYSGLVGMGTQPDGMVPGTYSGGVSAIIEWGDGTTSTGAVTAGTGFVYLVSGSHTYTHRGEYPIDVVASHVASGGGTVTYDGVGYGLAYVFAPTDHKGPQEVTSLTVTGGGTDHVFTDKTLGYDMTGGYSGSIHDDFVPSLSEIVDEPTGEFTLSLERDFEFSLSETGNVLAIMPNSTLTATGLETDARTETDAAPNQHGTITTAPGGTYTVSQTGSAASETYNLSEYESLAVLGTGSEVESEGSYALGDSNTTTLTTNAFIDLLAGTYSETFSGSDTTTLVRIGFQGPDNYTNTETEGDSHSGTETGGFYTGVFNRLDLASGSYSLSQADTYTGGSSSESGGAAFLRTLTASGTEATNGSWVAGLVTAHHTGTDTFTESGSPTLDSVVATETLTQTATTTEDITGNEVTGADTISVRETSTSTGGASETDEGVPISESDRERDTASWVMTGNLVSGSYSLAGSSNDTATVWDTENAGGEDADSTDTDIEAVSASETGERWSGTYTRLETDSGTDYFSATEHGVGTAAADAEESGTDSWTDIQRDTTGDVDSITESGNRKTGALYRIDTDTYSDTDLATDSNILTDTGSANVTDSDVDYSTDIGQGTTSETQSENWLTGSYSDSWGGNESDTDTQTESIGDDGPDRNDHETDRLTDTITSNFTATETGNIRTGTFTLTESGSSTDNERATDSVSATDTAPGGDTDTNQSTDTITGSSNDSWGATIVGNWVDGIYTETFTDSASASESDSWLANQISTLILGGSDTSTDTASGSGSDSGSNNVRSTILGNWVTGEYSLSSTKTHSASDSGTSSHTTTDTGTGDGSHHGLDTGTGSTSDSENDTCYITASGDSIDGDYTQTETDYNTSSVYDSATDHDIGTQSAAVTDVATHNVTGSESDSDHSTITTVWRGNWRNGDYTISKLGAVTSTLSTNDSEWKTNTAQAGTIQTGNGLETSTDAPTVTDVGTFYLTATGNEADGSYHVTRSAGSTQNQSDHWTDGQTSTNTAAISDTNTDDSAGSNAYTSYPSSAYTLTGNDLDGMYSLTETVSNFGSNTETDSDTPSISKLRLGSLNELWTDPSNTTATFAYLTNYVLASSGNSIDERYSQSQTGTYQTSDTNRIVDISGYTNFIGGTDASTDTSTATGSDLVTEIIRTVRSGSYLTGDFSFGSTATQTATDSSTSTDTTSESDSMASTLIRRFLDNGADTLTDLGTSTLIESGSGSLATGSYTQTATDSYTGSKTNRFLDNPSITNLLGGSDVAIDHLVNYDSATMNGVMTTTESGNLLTGAFTLSATGSNADSDTATDTDTSSNSESIGGTLVGTGNETSTDTITSSATESVVWSASGSPADGTYSQSETDSLLSTDSGRATVSANETNLLGGSDASTDGTTDTLAGSQTESSTFGSFENLLTGAYSLWTFDTTTASSSDLGTDTGSELDTITGTTVDTGTNIGSHSSTEFATDTFCSSAGGNFASGSYSESATDSARATDTDRNTDVATDTHPVGDDRIETDTLTGSDSVTQIDAATTSESGNIFTGDYSLSNFASETGTEADSNTEGMVETDTGGHGTDNNTDAQSGSDTSTVSSSASGNLATGEYTQASTESGRSTSTDHDTDNSATTDTVGGSDIFGDTASDDSTSTESEAGSATLTGNMYSGAYSLTSNTTASQNESDTNSDAGTTDDWIAGTEVDSGTDTLSDTLSEGSTDTVAVTASGNAYNGDFTQTVTDSGHSTASDRSTDTGSDSLVGTDGGTDSMTSTDSGSSTSTLDGNILTGSYTSTSSDSSTATNTDANSDEQVQAGSTADESGSDTLAATDSAHGTASGNFYGGAYTQTDTGTEQAVDDYEFTDQGITDPGTDTILGGVTSVLTGNDLTGAYSQTLTNASDTTTSDTGSDARGPYTSTVTEHATSTSTLSGNSFTGDATQGLTMTDTRTDVRSGGTGGTTYTQTVVASDTSNDTSSYGGLSGVGTDAASRTLTATTTETGATPATGYTLTYAIGATASDGSTSYPSGSTTATHSESSTGSLHEEGNQGTAAEYTLDKTTTGSRDTSQSSDWLSGLYSLTGTTGTSSTAIETNVHGTYAATFTEILEDDASLSGSGDAWTGGYTLSQIGSRTANFVNDGADAAGAVHVTEGSSGSYTDTTVGDAVNGHSTLTETAPVAYSATETVSGSSAYSWTENGSDNTTAVETTNAVTGAYTRTENGTDIFTLQESGSSFSQTLTGTDNCTSTDTGNRAQQTSFAVTTGGGTWTRTSSGSSTLGTSSGTNTYTLTESGNARAAELTEAESGTDRYRLVDAFDDVSNTRLGNTPGNVTFHSHGLPFRDPGPDGDPIIYFDKSKGKYIIRTEGDNKPLELTEELYKKFIGGLDEDISDWHKAVSEAAKKPIPQLERGKPAGTQGIDREAKTNEAAAAVAKRIDEINQQYEDAARRVKELNPPLLLPSLIDPTPLTATIQAAELRRQGHDGLATATLALAALPIVGPKIAKVYGMIGRAIGAEQRAVAKAVAGVDALLKDAGAAGTGSKTLDNLLNSFVKDGNKADVAKLEQEIARNAAKINSELVAGVTSGAETISKQLKEWQDLKTKLAEYARQGNDATQKKAQEALGKVLEAEEKLKKDLEAIKALEKALDDWCFAPETLVATATGSKRIGDIQVGEQVWAFDFDSGQWVLGEVLRRHDNRFSGVMASVIIGNTRLEVTANHPFWVVEGLQLKARPAPSIESFRGDEGKSLRGRWVNSHQMLPGDSIVCRDGQIRRIDRIELSLVIEKHVCNLTVKGFPTYAVGTDSILVHNESWCAQYARLSGREKPEALLKRAKELGLDESQIHGHHIVMKGNAGPTDRFSWIDSEGKWHQFTQADKKYVKDAQDLLERNDISVLRTKPDVERAGKEGLDNLSFALNKHDGIHSPAYAKAVLKRLQAAEDSAIQEGKALRLSEAEVKALAKERVQKELAAMRKQLENGRKFW